VVIALVVLVVLVIPSPSPAPDNPVALQVLDDAVASGDYSTRAVAASLCVASANDPKVYTDFYAALFASDFQPKEGGSSDPSDSELAQRAESVGAPSSVADCITSGQEIDNAKTKCSTATPKSTRRSQIGSTVCRRH
jgi:hypothetical protein